MNNSLYAYATFDIKGIKNLKETLCLIDNCCSTTNNATDSKSQFQELLFLLLSDKKYYKQKNVMKHAHLYLII